MIVNRFLIAVLFCIGFSLNGLAQNPSDTPASKEDVERYFQAVHSRDMMQKVLEVMSKSTHQMTHELCAKDKDKLPADCEDRMNRFTDNLMNKLPYDQMMQAMVPAYQKHFTKADMDTLIAFYSAPTGQKVLREMPAIMTEAMDSMMPIMRRSVDDMTQSIQQQIAQMRKDSPKTTEPKDN
jgi:hypothetical protein